MDVLDFDLPIQGRVLQLEEPGGTPLATVCLDQGVEDDGPFKPDQEVIEAHHRRIAVVFKKELACGLVKITALEIIGSHRIPVGIRSEIRPLRIFHRMTHLFWK